MFEKDDVQILNEGDSTEVSRAIDDFFASAEPDDTLFLYYTGHGRSLNQQLFLCAQNTLVERLHSTAISQTTLNAIVASTLAQVRIIVLDCCYGGLFKGSEFIDGLSGRGRYVIAATSAMELAGDSSRRGEPSPFTHALAEGLNSKAEDRDRDGLVDLDDLFGYLNGIPLLGQAPQRKFDGSGAIPIAKRPSRVTADHIKATDHALRDEDGAKSGPNPTTPSTFLDTPALDAIFSPERVSKFRLEMRSDISESMPTQLTAAEFLQRAELLRNGHLSYAGVLLFSDSPTIVLPSAMVQCVRFSGIGKTEPLESTDLQGPVPDLIVQARDFVAELARIGEAPTTEGAYAETMYSYPMIAVREIIANAVVHRDYWEQGSCVQIHAFKDRVEIISPGDWGGSRVIQETESRLSQLERDSQRRNFRLARVLTWSKLVEGVGAGLPRAIADCNAVGAREPMVKLGNGLVNVTIFPRDVESDVFRDINVVRNDLGTENGRLGASSSRSPLYRQIADELRSQIESGELEPGSRLGVESDLQEQYKASRNTVRDAIKWLITRNLVETRPGQGTFVVEKVNPFVTTLSRNEAVDLAYAAEVQASGRVPTITQPSIEIQVADSSVADALRIAEGTGVVVRHARRYIDDTPFSLQTSYYPMTLVQRGAIRLLQADAIREGDMAYLRTQLGIAEAGCRDSIAARSPNETEASFFKLPNDGRISVFEIFRVDFDETGVPLGLIVTVYPADRNRFVISFGKDVGDDYH
jgi:predicted HTH transcriptional regulator